MKTHRKRHQPYVFMTVAFDARPQLAIGAARDIGESS